jgi:hypothetical protein
MGSPGFQLRWGAATAVGTGVVAVHGTTGETSAPETITLSSIGTCGGRTIYTALDDGTGLKLQLDPTAWSLLTMLLYRDLR